jgi:hypothetical protein
VARALGYANTGNLRRALRRRGMEN